MHSSCFLIKKPTFEVIAGISQTSGLHSSLQNLPDKTGISASDSQPYLPPCSPRAPFILPRSPSKGHKDKNSANSSVQLTRTPRGTRPPSFPSSFFFRNSTFARGSPADLHLQHHHPHHCWMQMRAQDNVCNSQTSRISHIFGAAWHEVTLNAGVSPAISLPTHLRWTEMTLLGKARNAYPSGMPHHLVS